MKAIRLGADRALAGRLERIAAEDLRRIVEATRRVYPECAPSTLGVGGGVAAFLGEHSPVNGCLGLGFSEPVTHAEIEAIEQFFADRGVRALVNSSSLAGESLELRLYERGWESHGCEDVMMRALRPGEAIPRPDSEIEVRLARSAEDRALWADVAANGFVAPEDPSADDIRLCRAVAAREDAWLLLAFVGGHPAGAAELSMRDGVAWLSTDATLPEFRRRGVQTTLQRARLAIADGHGCEIAVSEALPNSESRRNMVRLGFMHAYSRREWAAPE